MLPYLPAWLLPRPRLPLRTRVPWNTSVRSHDSTDVPLVREDEAAHQWGELAGLEGDAEHGEGLLELGALDSALQYSGVTASSVSTLHSRTSVTEKCSH